MKTLGKILVATSYGIAFALCILVFVGPRPWEIRSALTAPVRPPAGVVTRSTQHKPLGLRVVSDRELVRRLRELRAEVRPLIAGGPLDPDGEPVAAVAIDNKLLAIIDDIELREGTLEAAGQGVAP